MDGGQPENNRPSLMLCVEDLKLLVYSELFLCWNTEVWLWFQTLCFHRRSQECVPGYKAHYAYTLSRCIDVFYSPSPMSLFCSSASSRNQIWSVFFKCFQEKRMWYLIVFFKQIYPFLGFSLEHMFSAVSLWLMVWINSEDTQQPLQGALRLSDVAT